MFEFDEDGDFVREIGAGLFGFEFAHKVRVDRYDNIWAVDEGSNQVIKFNPEGRVTMVLGYRPPSVQGATASAGGAGPDERYLFARPTDVTWDTEDNIFVSDGYTNHRVVKYSPDGKYITQVGSGVRGDGLDELSLPHTIASDDQGNIGFTAAAALPARAQIPQIQYQAVDALSDFPDDIHMGEAAGVARNSDGDIFVYTRTGNPMLTLGTSRYVTHGGSRLFQFDSDGEFEREIGQETYGALYAQQVRIDGDDNIWTVDQFSGQVIKFDPDGRIVMVMSRKPETLRVPQRPPPETPPSGVGREGESFAGPTDVAWDSQGNFYVADGIRNARIAKYEPTGKWTMNWGTRGTGPGEFDVIQGIAIDAQDNIYVADYANRRIQVFDTQGNFRRAMTGFGAPMAICITPPPNQVMYVSNSNPPDNLDVGGEIYKMELNGTIMADSARPAR